MTLTPSANLPPLETLIRPGDLVTWGQAMAEPRALIDLYIAARHRIGPTRAFVGLTFTDTIRPEHRDRIRLQSYGALGTMARLHTENPIDILPCRYSTLPHHMEAGRLRPDVVLLQLSPPGPDGTHSLGWCNDLLPSAMENARIVLAEINPNTPWVRMDQPFDETRITHCIESAAPLPTPPATEPGQAEIKIAGHLAPWIPEGATLQYGIGAAPAAILRALRGHRDLGLHSGLVTEDIIELVECGTLTNARKEINPGIAVGGVAVGGQRLATFLQGNRAYLSCRTEFTHSAATLSRFDRLVALNSALEIDLLGQINAEAIGPRYLGAIGGQPDFMHAATQAEQGLSIIALPATGGREQRSRIVETLNTPLVTTARSDVDLIATEYGVADLRGKSITERASALAAIAAPAHRDRLARTARSLA